jgi:type I restriction enzyme M protein
LTAIKHDSDAADERKLLDAYANLIEQEATASKVVKDAQKALDTKVAAQYAKLTEAEIKTWWWKTNGWPHSRHKCKANWIASVRR